MSKNNTNELETEAVVFHWSRKFGDCYGCGRPAAFYLGGYGGPQEHNRYCAVCAANHAVDGERVLRINSSKAIEVKVRMNEMLEHIGYSGKAEIVNDGSYCDANVEIDGTGFGVAISEESNGTHRYHAYHEDSDGEFTDLSMPISDIDDAVVLAIKEAIGEELSRLKG